MNPSHQPRPYQECDLRNIFAAIIGSALPSTSTESRLSIQVDFVAPELSLINGRTWRLCTCSRYDEHAPSTLNLVRWPSLEVASCRSGLLPVSLEQDFRCSPTALLAASS